MIFWCVNKITLSGFTFYANTMPAFLMHGCFLYSFWRTMWFVREIILWVFIYFFFNLSQPPGPRNYVPTNVPIFMNPRKLVPTKINDFTVQLISFTNLLGSHITKASVTSAENYWKRTCQNLLHLWCSSRSKTRWLVVAFHHSWQYFQSRICTYVMAHTDVQAT